MSFWRNLRYKNNTYRIFSCQGPEIREILKFKWMTKVFKNMLFSNILAVTYSGSNPFFIAFCLNCCFCLSFSSFSYKSKTNVNTNRQTHSLNLSLNQHKNGDFVSILSEKDLSNYFLYLQNAIQFSLLWIKSQLYCFLFILLSLPLFELP